MPSRHGGRSRSSRTRGKVVRIVSNKPRNVASDRSAEKLVAPKFQGVTALAERRTRKNERELEQIRAMIAWVIASVELRWQRLVFGAFCDGQTVTQLREVYGLSRPYLMMQLHKAHYKLKHLVDRPERFPKEYEGCRKYFRSLFVRLPPEMQDMLRDSVQAPSSG